MHRLNQLDANNRKPCTVCTTPTNFYAVVVAEDVRIPLCENHMTDSTVNWLTSKVRGHRPPPHMDKNGKLTHTK